MSKLTKFQNISSEDSNHLESPNHQLSEYYVLIKVKSYKNNNNKTAFYVWEYGIFTQYIVWVYELVVYIYTGCSKWYDTWQKHNFQHYWIYLTY